MHNLTLTALITGFQHTEFNLITLVATVTIVLGITLSSYISIPQNVAKRLEAAEASNAICLANLNALMLNLAALHKARIIRNETKKRYNDNRRSAELISATHKAEVNYKQAKEFLSSYVIEATR
jgi:hypothetical protein